MLAMKLLDEDEEGQALQQVPTNAGDDEHRHADSTLTGLLRWPSRICSERRNVEARAAVAIAGLCQYGRICRGVALARCVGVRLWLSLISLLVTRMPIWSCQFERQLRVVMSLGILLAGKAFDVVLKRVKWWCFSPGGVR